MDSLGLVDSPWASEAREQLLEDLALLGEDGGAVAGNGSGGARSATGKLLFASFIQQKRRIQRKEVVGLVVEQGLPRVLTNGNRGGRACMHGSHAGRRVALGFLWG